MKKRLFVLFMAAVVGFTGMPVTFANAADDATVATSEDDQPSALQTVSGNYGVKLDSDTRFSGKLTGISKTIYDTYLKKQLIDSSWKLREDVSKKGAVYLEITGLAVTGSYEPATGKIQFPGEGPEYVTAARDNVFAAFFNAFNALQNTYPTQLAGLDLENFVFDGKISNKAEDTKIVLEIPVMDGWSIDLDKAVENIVAKKAEDKIIEGIIKDANDYVNSKDQYKENPKEGVTAFFDAWLVDNVQPYSSESSSLADTYYGAFLNHEATDEGYASAMSYLLDKMEIDNQIVFGTVNWENNKYGYWNTVSLDGKTYYVVDTYQNDVDVYGKYTDHDKINTTTRPYFMIGTSQYSYYYYLTGNGKFYDNAYISSLITNMEYSPVSDTNYYKEADAGKQVVIQKGKSGKVYEKDILKSAVKEKAVFTSDQEDVVKVSKKGVLKAKKPGKATITVKRGTIEDKVTVYVYSIDSVKFADKITGNDKTDKENDKAYVGRPYSFLLKVNTSTTIDPSTKLSAQKIKNVYNDNNAKKAFKIDAKSSKKKVASLGNIAVMGDYMVGTINCAKPGKAKITFYYGNKKAKLSLEVERETGAGY